MSSRQEGKFLPPSSPYQYGVNPGNNNNWGPPEVAPSEVEKFSVLGDGSFGTVYVGRCRSKDVAVKMLHIQDLDEKTRAAFRQEVEIMSKIFHPNIILFMGACTVPGNYMIITELMPRGDLDSLLRNHKIQLSNLLRIRMAKDAALGMTWLHGSNPQFIHRDLKTSNLLVDENNRIKICDFGLSQIKTKGENLFDGSEGAKGTPLSMAPEVMCGLEFNEKCDVYSFGIVLWEILTREEPFQEYETFDEFRTAVCFHHARPQIPPSCHPSLRQLIECCWDPNPQKRPSFPVIVQALEHIIVEYAIMDEIGKRLWKERFLKREFVLYNQFLSSFFDVLDYYGNTTYQLLPDNYPTSELRNASYYQLRDYGSRSIQNAVHVENEYIRRAQAGASEAAKYYDDLKLLCLKTLLVEKGSENEEIVTMENFGNMLNWFGPIVDMNTRKVVLLDNIFDILSTEWFHGDVTLEEAEYRLEKRQIGTFLVRYSSLVGCYTVSKVCRENNVNRIIHQRIIRTPGRGYSIVNNVYYPSLVELIAQSKNDLELLHACPGSRYINSIFKPSSSVYVYVEHNFQNMMNNNDQKMVLD